MQKKTISSAQFYSSHYLQQLSNQHILQLIPDPQAPLPQLVALASAKDAVSKISDAVSNASDAVSNTRPPVLVVSADALNLEKLYLVQRAVATLFSITGWQIAAARSATGHNLVARGLCAGIQTDGNRDTEQLNDLLENIATVQQVELSMVYPDAPILAQPGLLVMDMDSTVINMECIDHIAQLAGVGEKVAKVTEQAMCGDLDFSASLRQRVACLADADESILTQVQHSLPLMPGIEALVIKLQKHGWKVAIASGGFTYFANYLKDRLGLDAAFSNQLALQNGKLTGEVVGDIVDAQKKAEVVVQLATQYQIPLSQTVAMGDGANDLVMMAQAGLGVAYKAKPIVRQKAQTAIRFGGLDLMLEYLG